MRGKPRNMFGKLAAQAVEHYVKTGEHLNVERPHSAELMLQRACYVSIYEQPGKRLRWFYGNAMPQQPCLAFEIISNTVHAIATPGVKTVTKAALTHLSYSVSVLGPLQRVSGTEHLDPAVYGLYVVSDRGKPAVMLPQREGIETADDQLATAIREAGINPRAETFTLYRFDVDYYDE